MTNRVPIAFRKTTEPATATYDYFDIAEGTGIKKFYGFTTSGSTGTSYILSDQQLYSFDIATVTTGVEQTSFTKTIDYDFDLAAFNLPKTITGTAYVEQSIHLLAGALDQAWAYTTYTLNKWDGATATQIGTGTTGTMDVSATSGSNHYVIPISCTKTSFKKGEQLRLSTETYVKCTGTSPSFTVSVGHDPQNRDDTELKPSEDTNIITQLNCYVPFDLDI